MIDVISPRLTTRWPSTRFAPYGQPGDAVPGWYGRKAPATVWPTEFIRAVTIRRADGLQTLTPPRDVAPAHPVRDALIGLAAVAGLGGLAWWLVR